jgi:hypothetical protein
MGMCISEEKITIRAKSMKTPSHYLGFCQCLIPHPKSVVQVIPLYPPPPSPYINMKFCKILV